eukprot:scaffold11564_cov116-Isochrysis_galbana.AAC.4
MSNGPTQPRRRYIYVSRAMSSTRALAAWESDRPDRKCQTLCKSVRKPNSPNPPKKKKPSMKYTYEVPNSPHNPPAR